jgi:hypothetical protein
MTEMITRIEYYRVPRMGRMDYYPTDPAVIQAVQLMKKNQSPVMTTHLIMGLQALGIEFKEVVPPASGEKV